MSDPEQDTAIGRWLESIGMGEYAAAFNEHHLTLEMLGVLTDADLKECGVNSMRDRKQILAAIQQGKHAAAQTSSMPAAEAGQPGKLGHFELLEKMGSGGMGTVYRAWDSTLNRQVAIKVLDRSLATDQPQFFQDFIREAQNAAGINHPHIVQIYFVGEDAGEYYLAMELLEGQTLDDRLDRGPMDETNVLKIARQVVEALAATNARRLIHGDIKPQNIFLTKNGDVKLLDFGLARKANTSGLKEGGVMGSAYYISPERSRGLTEDFRSDIYSLGATMFHAISGMYPFDSDDLAALVRKRLDEDAPRLRGVKPNASPALDQLLAKMLARDPAKRHQSYETLLKELTAAEKVILSGFDPGQKLKFAVPSEALPVLGASEAFAQPQMAHAPQSRVITRSLPAGTGTFVVTGPAVEAPQSKRGLRAKLASSRIFVISVILHILFGAGATLLIVQSIHAKRKLTFQNGPGTPNPSTRALEHKVNMSRKQQTMSAPAQAKRITTSGVAKITLPDMPSLPSATELMPNKMGGMGGTGVGFGPGGGGGGGGGAGKGLTMFGMREGGNGLAGTFYDLKQKNDGKPTDMVLQPNEQGGAFFLDAPVNNSYDHVLAGVVSGGMGETSLSKYFRGPRALYLTQLFIPAVPADEAPKAFNLDNVRGRRWVVLYRGQVVAPESGRFRFAGFGDDILVVRFNNRVVLDASFAPPTRKANRKTYPHSGLAHGWQTVVGESFETRAGSPYSMELLIGERPGGEYSGYLLLEKEGVQYEKDGAAPLLPIFKLAPSPMPPRGPMLPPVAPDTSWSVWKSQPVRSLGF